MGSDVAQRLLENLGGGVLAGPQRMDLSPGVLQPTGNPLDVALTDDSSFFAVESVDPRTGRTDVHLTRDGRLSRDAQGYLVTPSGHRLLDDGDRPIRLNGTAAVTIDSTGRLLQNGEPVAQLQLSTVDRPGELRKLGNNLYAIDPGNPRKSASNATVEQGFTESSGADAIRTLMEMINATKAVTSNANLIRYHDTLMDRAVNVLGRVA